MRRAWREEIFGGNILPQVDKMATTLYDSKDVELWKETFELYEKMLQLKAENEKKEKMLKLLDLDKW